jgi:hypothetical protein
MISSIHQSERIYLIGTANGLIRYDGYNFLRYVRNNDMVKVSVIIILMLF